MLIKTPYLRVILLIVLTSAPTLIHAAAEGSVSGTVRDRSGAVVPKVNITATNLETNVRQSATTDGAGIAFACSFIMVGFLEIIRLEPPIFWSWISSYFVLCTIVLLWLAFRAHSP